MLLTRPPLAGRSRPVRLACIRRAASVRPEPGSNSPDEPAIPVRGLLRVRWNRPPTCVGCRVPAGTVVGSDIDWFACELLAHHSAVVKVRFRWGADPGQTKPGVSTPGRTDQAPQRIYVVSAPTLRVSSGCSPENGLLGCPNETGFLPISQPALVLYRIGPTVSRAGAIGFHTHLGGLFGAAERNRAAGALRRSTSMSIRGRLADVKGDFGAVRRRLPGGRLPRGGWRR